MQPVKATKEKEFSEFFDRIEKKRAEEAAANRMQNSPGVKVLKIKHLKNDVKEKCAGALFAKIYRDSLPMDEEFKIGNRDELDTGAIEFIKLRCPTGCYDYVVESEKNGSVYAKRMHKAIDETVNSHFRKFYESLADTDTEQIKFDMDSEEGDNLIRDISAKLDYDEISKIIENNVQQTVQNEIERTKEEDERMQAIQEKLAQNEAIVTEEAIDRELYRMGVKNERYVPSLFSGIMIDKVNQFSESADDIGMENVQKKAFFESVKEFTKWSMISVMGLENFKQKDIDQIATRYARSGK